MVIRNALVMIALMLTAGVSQAAIILPAPNSPFNSLNFGDATVYSMAFLNYLESYPPGTPLNPGDTYYVPSSGGQIGPPNDLIIASFPNGNLGNASAVADDAYKTPNAGSTAHYTFATSASAPDSDPTFTGDIDGAWDVSTTEVLSRLAADNAANLLFWFNLNESGTENELSGQDMLVWGQVELIDLDGISANKSYFLTGNGSPVGPTAFDGRNDWAYVHSTITVDNGAFLHLGPSVGGVGEELSQNLGANNAAFGAYFAELDDLLHNDPNYDILRVRLELGQINNGYEQLFIRGANIQVEATPEPASLAIWGGIGLAGLVAGWRRKRTQASKLAA